MSCEPKSRTQSRTNLGETLPQNLPPPLHQAPQDRQEPPRQPTKDAGVPSQPPRPEPTTLGQLPGPSGGPPPNLGNNPMEDGKPTRILSKREIRELQKKEKKARELREKLEVRHDPHLLQRQVTLIPPQREEKRKELEREKAEKEARKLQEKLEVRCGSFQENALLTEGSFDCYRRSGGRNSNAKRRPRNSMKGLR